MKPFVALSCLAALISFQVLHAVPLQQAADSLAAGSLPQESIGQLIRQARNGSVKAYETLAACYRNGNGLPQSYFNMFMTYRLACKKTGRDVLEILETLDEDHPFRLLIEILNHREIERIPPELVDQLHHVSPTEARVFDAIRIAECYKDTKSALRLLKEAESEGSEMACIVRVLVVNHINDTKDYRKALRRYAKRFPSLYVQLGDCYLTQTAERSELRRAVKYYRWADLYGMLSAADARKLLSACIRLKTLTRKAVCGKAERIRLESLAASSNQ